MGTWVLGSTSLRYSSADLPPGGEDALDFAFAQQAADVVWYGVFDAGIGRARDVAPGDGVPQRNMVLQAHGALFRDGRGSSSPSTAASTRQKRFCGCP